MQDEKEVNVVGAVSQDTSLALDSKGNPNISYCNIT